MATMSLPRLSSLAAILTQSNWQDRILGKSEMVVLPHKICWIGTGNNIRLGGDLPRRCYWIRLDAKEARPWQRKKFKHPELIQWVTDNRGRIIVAILTVAMAWMQAGRPQAPDLPVMGSFENWVRVIGDLLHYLGIEGFLNNLELMYETADDDTPQWEAFITTWHQLLGEAFLTVPELVQKIQEKPELATALPLDLIDSIKEKGFTRKLGKALSHRSGVQFTNQLKIQKGKPEHKALTWAVKPKDWEPPQAMKLDLEV